MKHIFPIFFLLFLNVQLFSQKTTIVKGQVFDKKTNETIPYATIQFEGTSIGVTSDINGRFYVSTTLSVSKVKISYIGYKNQIISIKNGEQAELKVELDETTTDLNEVVVKVEKYRNKDNPAVALIKKVIANKDLNRNESFDYFNYKKYEKVELAYNNVTNKTKNNLLFKSMKFVFNYADTNNINGKVNLPFFLRESLADVYYRKDPNDLKEYIRGERNTLMPGIFDNVGIANFIQNLSLPVDIYKNSIELVTVDFISPISPIAPNIYRFYILDTSYIKETPVVHLYFAPRQKADLAFIGHMWIALDSSYAVRKIELGIPVEINLNWVKELQLIQEFDWVLDSTKIDSGKPKKKGLMLTKDDIFMDFGITRKEDNQSILGNKSIIYSNIEINKPLNDNLFKTNVTTFRDIDSEEKSDEFWSKQRPVPLNKKDLGIIQMIDSLGKHKPFQRMVKIARLVLEGYTSIGKINIGPVNTFYSFNDIEGLRGRFGGRTNTRLSKRFLAEGYAAYGFKDKAWKEYFGIKYSFDNINVLRFPYNQIRVWFQNDIKIPGQALQFVQEDNFLLSFKRGVNNKMIYNKVFGVEYDKEFQNGFSYFINTKIINQKPAGILKFEYTQNGQVIDKKDLNSTEVNFNLRYAPNEKFYQTSLYRVPIVTEDPVFSLLYTAGIKDIFGSEYNYHSLELSFEKIFSVSPIGWSDITFDIGRIFGKVPYPLLNIHHANQTYAYQFDSYNLMNFLEFVSDKYVAFNIFHNFGGFFFNRIPLIKKLKLREVFTCKILYGGLDNSNRPGDGNELFKFPVDENGKNLTFTLDKTPYIEASVGIDNIFKFFRVDYVRRLTYLSNPNVSASGIRARFRVEF